MTRHPATAIYSQARGFGEKDLRKRFPADYRLLLDAARATLELREGETARRFADRVRYHATHELIDLHFNYYVDRVEYHKRRLRAAAGLPPEGAYKYVAGKRVSGKPTPPPTEDELTAEDVTELGEALQWWRGDP